MTLLFLALGSIALLYLFIRWGDRLYLPPYPPYATEEPRPHPEMEEWAAAVRAQGKEPMVRIEYTLPAGVEANREAIRILSEGVEDEPSL